MMKAETCFNSAEIELFHKGLALALSARLGYDLRVALNPDGEREWANAAPGGRPVVFQVLPRTQTTYLSRSARDQGDPCLALPLYEEEQFEPTVWLSWQEQWLSRGRDRFRLDGASWTYYWGSSNLEDKCQIVRAEWDNHETERETARREGATGDSPPQPHWHVDIPMLAMVYPQGVRPYSAAGNDCELQEKHSGAGLVERGVAQPEPRLALQDVRVSGVHLAMGWRQDVASHPECWQCTMGDLNHLADWAASVLDHVRAEFRRLKPGAPVYA